jgi:hypothetical protein
MKNAVFWTVALVRTDVPHARHISQSFPPPPGHSCIPFYRFVSHIAVFLRSVLQLLVAAIVVPNSLVLSILMMEKIRSSETSVVTRIPWRHTTEDGILNDISTLKNAIFWNVMMWLL